MACGGADQQQRFGRGVGTGLGRPDYRPSRGGDVTAHWMNFDSRKPPSRPHTTFPQTRESRSTRPSKAPAQSHERQSSSALFATHRRGGNIILHHRHIKPVLVRQWSPKVDGITATIWPDFRSWWAGPTSRTITAAIQRECVRLVNAVAPQQECDLVADYSRPIQNTLFAALFDVPESEVDICAQWIVDVLQHGDAARRSRAVGQMTKHIGRRTAELRTEEPSPQDDSGMLHILTRATVEGAPLPDDAIRDIGFVMASLDTLANSISFGFRYLAVHPELQYRLAAELIAPTAVVDELLRLHSVVSTARTARRDTTVAGTRIREGGRVLLCLSLADRDPETYTDPLEANFDQRNSPGHLAFGAGSHRCLGSGIATQAFATALREWHRRIPTYTASTPATTSGGGEVGVLPISSLARHRPEGAITAGLPTRQRKETPR
jgi:hypothetical protein